MQTSSNTTNNIIFLNEIKMNSSVFHKINLIEIKKASAILRALNHKLRQSIIKLLDEKKNLSVTEIYVKLRIEQSVASQHLAILRRADILTTQREGKNIYYNVNYARIDEINQFVKSILNEIESDK